MFLVQRTSLSHLILRLVRLWTTLDSIGVVRVPQRNQLHGLGLKKFLRDVDGGHSIFVRLDTVVQGLRVVRTGEVGGVGEGGGCGLHGW